MQLKLIKHLEICNRKPISFYHVVDFLTYNIYFQQLVDLNQGLLKTLGVSHASLDLVQSLTAKQSLHSKLTGAGGGGFAFALVTPNHKIEQIQQTKELLEENGFEGDLIGTSSNKLKKNSVSKISLFE